MAITTKSAKSKARKLQQWVRDKVLSLSPMLRPEDVKSTTMGESGTDIQLSPYAKDRFPWVFECKANKSFAVYKVLEQCQSHAKQGEVPIVVLKGDRKDPVVVVDADWFFEQFKEVE